MDTKNLSLNILKTTSLELEIECSMISFSNDRVERWSTS